MDKSFVYTWTVLENKFLKTHTKWCQEAERMILHITSERIKKTGPNIRGFIRRAILKFSYSFLDNFPNQKCSWTQVYGPGPGTLLNIPWSPSLLSCSEFPGRQEVGWPRHWFIIGGLPGFLTIFRIIECAVICYHTQMVSVISRLLMWEFGVGIS